MNKLFSKIIDYNRPEEPYKKAKWFFRFAVPFFGALILEVILTLLTGLGEGLYGTPLPVGECKGFLGLGVYPTFSVLIFIVNVLITFLFFLAVTWWSGIIGGIVMTTGGVLFTVAFIALVLGTEEIRPFLEGPLAIFFSLLDYLNPVTFWLFIIFVGFLFAATWRRFHNAWRKKQNVA
jgi:hypothetical protein